MKVFVDANVLFSASNATSHIAELIRLLIDRGQAVTSDLAAEEARRNLEQKRPAWAGNLAPLLAAVKLVATQAFALTVTLAAKDVPILCSAIRARCTHLVTSDKRDFAHLYGQTVQGVTIITLLRLSEILTDQN